MKDTNGVVLYVGKAKNLKNRVKSYFSKTSDSRYQIQFLMNKVADISYIVTDTEKEALILENTLIKQHRPKYNINLRDDKTYFSIRLDLREEFPRLTIIRRVTRDGARYFGPYASAAAAREMVKQLYRIFPLRHYPLETCRRRRRPCLFYQIGQCSAPCHGLISREKYAELAEGAALFLEGKSRRVIDDIKARMTSAAAAEKYEEAGRYRDLIRAIEVTLEKQKVVAPEGEMDVLGYYREGQSFEITLLFIRGGNLIGSRNFSLTWELDDTEALSSFLIEYYSGDVFIPRDILIPIALEDAEPLGELLSEQTGGKVRVTFPSRGVKHDLVKMAVANAATAAAERHRKKADAAAVLTELQEKLHLSRLPRRIECYDISNIQGSFPVGSRVAFAEGLAEKRLYRHYRIKTVEGANDFAMMKEVLTRRFDGNSADAHPDLIIVDGGIGQLNILIAVLEEIGIAGIDVAGLAKSRVERDALKPEVTKSEERVFLPGRKNPVILRQNSAPLLLLARIRDEAHRFAITYHKKLRGKDTLRSTLEEIPGVGEKRRRALLKHLGSLKKLREAPLEVIAAVPGIPHVTAEAVYRALHPEESKKKGGEPALPPSS